MQIRILSTRNEELTSEETSRNINYEEMSPIRTNAGSDVIAMQSAGGSASATATAHWMAITANATTPSATDTTLTGELTTTGLIRAAATFAHTAGTSVYTLTRTFTTSGTDVVPVTLAKIGIFDAITSGNLCFETLLSATATLTVLGDAVTVTHTITF